MEEVLVILLLVIFFLLLNVKKSIAQKFKTLQDKIDVLSAELKRTPSTQPTPKKSTLEDEIVQRAFKKPEPVVAKEDIRNVPETKKEEAPKKEETVVIPQVISQPSSQEPNRPPVHRDPTPKKPGFFERNPDLEKFIGENLANKIGIGILVLGIGFFVKYAIDQDWINEIGRVFIGILCGGILLRRSQNHVQRVGIEVRGN